MKRFHLGQTIEKVFRESPMAMVQFAKLIGVDRQTGYAIFKQTSMQTSKLEKISDALDHDFFKYFSEVHRVKTEKKILAHSRAQKNKRK